MIHSVQEMLAELVHHLQVLGLIQYGSDHQIDHHAVGDCDLFVVLNQKDPAVESLHFYIGDVPVDLNLTSLEEIGQLDATTTGFHLVALLDGRVLHDPTGQVTRELQDLRGRHRESPPDELSEQAIASTGHGHKHVFDKVRGRLTSNPVLCHFLLSADIYWLVQSYFQVRKLAFKGEKHAIEYLRNHEPNIFEAMAEFYTTPDLEQRVELAQTISDLVLAPIGGMWRKDEILAFGDETCADVQGRGYEAFHGLFGADQEIG